jgi:hypothetical protein
MVASPENLDLVHHIQDGPLFLDDAGDRLFQRQVLQPGRGAAERR